MKTTYDKQVNLGEKISWGQLGALVLVSLGVLALLYYFSWWFEDGRLRSPLYFLWFAAAVVFSMFQVLGVWVIDLAAFRQPQRSYGQVHNLTVDVFVTACGEDLRGPVTGMVSKQTMASGRRSEANKIWARSR